MSLEKSYLEEFRPSEREEIYGNKLNIERIFSQIDAGKMPNMMFTGNAGNGKTSTAHVVAKEVLGEFYANNCFIFNCSDKTGIDNIRENIIETAKNVPPLFPLRIYIMEESEELSTHAQNALKKPLEAPFDRYNRFIFLTNEINKFIPAIIDRCRVFYFMPINPEEMFERLKYISTTKKINISDDLIKELAKSSNGSMRYPILKLEEFESLNRKITIKDIKMVENLEQIKEIFVLLKEKKIPNAREKTLDLYQQGNNFNDIIRHFHDFTLISMKNDLNHKTKARTIIKIAEAERNVKEGCNEFIQISFMLSNISLLINEEVKK